MLSVGRASVGALSLGIVTQEGLGCPWEVVTARLRQVHGNENEIKGPCRGPRARCVVPDARLSAFRGWNPLPIKGRSTGGFSVPAMCWGWGWGGGVCWHRPWSWCWCGPSTASGCSSPDPNAPRAHSPQISEQVLMAVFHAPARMHRPSAARRVITVLYTPVHLRMSVDSAMPPCMPRHLSKQISCSRCTSVLSAWSAAVWDLLGVSY